MVLLKKGSVRVCGGGFLTLVVCVEGAEMGGDDLI